MFPILHKIGPVTIYSFGFALFLALILASFLIWKQARNRGLSEEKIFDSYLLTVFLSLIGARLGYVIINWSVFSVDLSRVLLVTHYPGLSFTWGLFTCLAAGFIAASLAGISGFLFLDIFAFAISWSILLGIAGAMLDGIIKTPVLLIASLLFAFVSTAVHKKIQKNSSYAILSRRYGLFISSYLIFLSSSLLITPGVARKEDNIFYLALLFIFIILFMVKFPASVLSQIKKYLEDKNKDAETRLKGLKKEDPFEDNGRLLDRASEDSEVQSKAGHERVAAMAQQLNMVLVQTRKALTKIKIGKYGICENCGKMIDTDRLAAMPTATLCLSCSKKREK